MKKPTSILFMSSWSYKEPLTHSYLLPYIRMVFRILPEGGRVYLQTYEKERWKMSEEERTAVNSLLEKEGIEWLPLQYTRFGGLAVVNYFLQVIRLSFFVRRKGIDVLHPFAPGAGTMALFVHFFTGRKWVMDSWEPHAESMVESGVWKKNSLAFKIMWWAERNITRRADVLIAANKGMVDYAKQKWNLSPSHVLYRPACVDLNKMDPALFDRDVLRKNFGLEGKVVCICTGKLDGMYMGEEVFAFFKNAIDEWGANFHALLLTETDPQQIQLFAKKQGVSPKSYSVQSVGFESVPEFLSMADFAFNPQKPLPSKRFGTPIKDGEYWAMGLPVVIQKGISEDSAIIEKDNIGVVMQDSSEASCRNAIEEIKKLLNDPEVFSRCREAAKRYRSFEIAEMTYRKIYS